jgi:RND family efflux transporter MFP subunit
MAASDGFAAGIAAHDSHAPQVKRAELDLAWRQFGTAGSPEDFCRAWLALQCHAIGEVNDGVVVLQKPGNEGFAPLAFWPEGQRDRSALVEITERGLREGRGVVQPRASGGGGSALPDRPDYQIAYPIRLDGKLRGVVGLDIAWREAPQLQAAMRQLQWGSAWLEVLLRRHADPVEAARQRMQLILQLTGIFLERPDFAAAAADLATETATRLGCDRVTLGLVQGGSMRIEAVSHSAHFDRRANLLAATAAAMNEALDQREAIAYPQDRDGRPVVTLAHAELAQLSGADGVVSVPLMHKGRVIGALTLERGGGHRFDGPTLELLEGLASMLGPLIEMRLEQGKSLAAQAAARAHGFWSRLVGPRDAGLKLGAGALAAAVLFLAFATGEYRVSADARIEGKVQRTLTAPFQGYVRESTRRAGDTVRQGEVLARLDDRDLRLEQARLAAQREQLGRQYREAMAKRDRAQARIVSAQLEQSQAQLALVEEHLQRTEVVAPFDGVIVSGDLTQMLGAPFERGQALFEIAPLDAYRVVLQVDEHRVADVRAEQRGELVLSSMPGRRLAIHVDKITPVSVAKEGRNFFRVEARLEDGPDPQLRPGMEGVAKVVAGEQRLAWIWTREVVNWVRLKAWAWSP